MSDPVITARFKVDYSPNQKSEEFDGVLETIGRDATGYLYLIKQGEGGSETFTLIEGRRELEVLGRRLEKQDPDSIGYLSDQNLFSGRFINLGFFDFDGDHTADSLNYIHDEGLTVRSGANRVVPYTSLAKASVSTAPEYGFETVDYGWVKQLEETSKVVGYTTTVSGLIDVNGDNVQDNYSEQASHNKTEPMTEAEFAAAKKSVGYIIKPLPH